jgi:hypothetical protein
MLDPLLYICREKMAALSWQVEDTHSTSSSVRRAVGGLR